MTRYMRMLRTLDAISGLMLVTLFAAVSQAQPSSGVVNPEARPAQLTLRAALDLALTENPSLRSAEAQRAAAGFRVWEARSGALPQISLNAGYSWSQEPNIVFPIHRAGVFPPLDDRIFESSLQATMPLFTGGKTGRRTDAARAGANQAEARGNLVRQDLLHQIALVYLGAAEIEDRRVLLGARLEDLRVRLDELRAGAAEGRTPPSQLALVYASVEQVRADSLQMEQAAGELALRLGQLTGLGYAVVPMPSGGNTPDAAGRVPDVPLHKADIADEANLEWQLAHAQKLQADAEASFASRAFFPDLSGFAVYNYRSSGSNWDPEGEWVAGLRLSFKLLDGGRSIAALYSTDASVRAAEENLRAIAQRTHVEREIALAARSAATARMQAIEEAVRQKEVFVAAQRSLHASGRLSLSELETQETELLQLALQGKTLRYEALRADIQAARAAGTLTQEYLLMISGEDAR